MHSTINGFDFRVQVRYNLFLLVNASLEKGRVMWQCEKCGEQIEESFDSCWRCANGGVEIVSGDEADIRIVSGVALATTPTLPGAHLVRSLGIVCGEAIIGANFVSDILAGITNVVGGRSGTYESKLKTARMIALNEMAQEAKDLGGNAVVGVDVDYETIRDSMLIVCASGTATISEPE